jgi:SAM-dependent methyltransferase
MRGRRHQPPKLVKSFKHWTPCYVVNRCLNIACGIVHPDWPWLAPDAVRFLEFWLKPSDTVFEWGAGRSTLWMARRVQAVTSVETDAQWYGRVKLQAEQEGLRNLELHYLAEPEDSEASFDYANAAAATGESFDLIVIDGLDRDRCALAALARLKPGGLLLLDNANWYLPCSSKAPNSRSRSAGPSSPDWALFTLEVSGWRRLWSSDGVTDTAIWIKPELPAEAPANLAWTHESRPA